MPAPVETRSRVPLPLFTLLEWPYGVTAGVISLVSMYLLRQHGVPIDKAAAISSFALLPASFYFVYAPVVDFLVRRRTWMIAAVLSTSVLSFVGIVESGSHHLRLIMLLLFAANVSNMLISAATGGLMGTMLTKAQKGQVGSWVQVGNLGGNAIGFGILVWLSGRLSLPLLGCVAAALMLPGMAVLLMREPPMERREHGPVATVVGMGSELRSILLSWRALPGMLLLMSPVGTGAMFNVLTGLTKEYGVSAAQLATIGGLGSGVATAVGSLAALLMPVRWNRLIPYALGSIFYAATAIAFGFGPQRASTFLAGALAISFMQGVCWGAYTGVILQTAAGPGTFHSSRYTILNSLGNLPVVYMTWLCGKVAARFGSHAVGYFDGGMNLLASGIFFVWWFFLRHPRQDAEVADVPLVLAEGDA